MRELKSEHNEPSSLKHNGPTPGPWQQSHRLCRNGLHNTQVYDAAGESIATLHWYPVKTKFGIGTNREANARLIAAAPDMLAALQECERALGIRRDFVPLGPALVLAPIIRAAIAKAEGAA